MSKLYVFFVRPPTLVHILYLRRIFVQIYIYICIYIYILYIYTHHTSYLSKKMSTCIYVSMFCIYIYIYISRFSTFISFFFFPGYHVAGTLLFVNSVAVERFHSGKSSKFPWQNLTPEWFSGGEWRWKHFPPSTQKNGKQKRDGFSIEKRGGGEN